jgi:hypothetical protein
MRKLQGRNVEDDLSTSKFLLLEKGLNRLGVWTSQRLGDRAINNAQEVLPNKDCLHKEGPLMIIGVNKSECGGFVGHHKQGLNRRRKRRWVHGKGQAKAVIEIGRLEMVTGSGNERKWQLEGDRLTYNVSMSNPKWK